MQNRRPDTHTLSVSPDACTCACATWASRRRRGALPTHHRAVSIAHRVQRGRSHAPARAHAAYNQRVGAQDLQVRRQRGAEERAGVLLLDHEVAGLGRQAVQEVAQPSVVPGLPHAKILALEPKEARVPHPAVRVLDRRPHHRHLSPARRGDEPLHHLGRRGRRLVCGQVERRPGRPVGLADVDEDQRRPGAPAHAPPEAGRGVCGVAAVFGHGVARGWHARESRAGIWLRGQAKSKRIYKEPRAK